MAIDIVLSALPVLTAIPAGAAMVIDVHDPAFPADPTKRTYGKIDPALVTPRATATVSGLSAAALADALLVAVFLPDNTALSTTLGALKAYIGAGGTAGVPTLALVMPTGVQPATSFPISGSFTNDGTAPVLTISVDAAAFAALPTGSTVSGGTISLRMPGLAAGTHTVQVQDGNGVLSNTVTFAAAAPETLTIGTIAAQTAGTAFAVSGTYANVTPTALDYSLDNASSWTAASNLTLSAGTFSISGVVIAAANAAATVKVRDHANQSILVTSAAFAVTAAPTTGASNDVTPGGTDPLSYHLLKVNGIAVVAGQPPALSLAGYYQAMNNFNVTMRNADGSTYGAAEGLGLGHSATDASIGFATSAAFLGDDGTIADRRVPLSANTQVGDVIYLWMATIDNSTGNPSGPRVQVGLGMTVGA